jgi:hypothetical protein
MITYKSSQKYFNPRTGEYYVVITLTGEKKETSDIIITDEVPSGDIVIVYSEDIQQAISELIDNAPEGLNTLGLLASELQKKEYSIEGKMLSENDFTNYYKEKLESVDFSANRYIHPKHHSFDDIIETSDRKIFLQIEREKLAAIEPNSNNYVHPEIHSANMIIETDVKKWFTFEERLKLADLENYTHPNSHPAEMINESITKNFVSFMEKERWNSKADLSDIDSKINNVVGILPDTIDLVNSLNIDENTSYEILAKLSNKVDKVPGMKLSKNDYTDVDREKLATVEFGANNYIHPKYHVCDDIKDLDNAISTNHIVIENNSKAHDKLHNINSLSNHIGVVGAIDDEIVIFNEDGFFKSSGFKLPTSDIIGSTDYQHIVNKTIDNTVIGESIARNANFLELSYCINSINWNNRDLLISPDICSSIIYIKTEVYEHNLPEDYTNILNIDFSNECHIGSFVHLYFVEPLDVIINTNDVTRIRGFDVGISIRKPMQIGNHFIIHKDSELGWTIFDSGWNK